MDNAESHTRESDRRSAVMPVNDVLAGIAVADLDSALGWYERLLGRPADAIPMDGLAEWHFADTGSIQLIRDAERAGNALLTLSVDDLREHVAVLDQRGLTPGAIDDTSSERVLFASITDPEGNTITLVEQRSAYS
jgi:catechol 2,3-dioxygenase-like lactoylglutathione lyase family enzyme